VVEIASDPLCELLAVLFRPAVYYPFLVAFERSRLVPLLDQPYDLVLDCVTLLLPSSSSSRLTRDSRDGVPDIGLYRSCPNDLGVPRKYLLPKPALEMNRQRCCK
jgi:hypothetical protein